MNFRFEPDWLAVPVVSTIPAGAPPAQQALAGISILLSDFNLPSRPNGLPRQCYSLVLLSGASSGAGRARESEFQLGFHCVMNLRAQTPGNRELGGPCRGHAKTRLRARHRGSLLANHAGQE